ncbi:site-specific DNA-methyltransferase [Desulfotomaculum nigrificans]|uniref:site-specific DNA-methyltransferase n=1 Tax=Desulfotomaculum nigrificans TaxID=1565 RepID=UPI0001FAE6F9|nr:site-specific DNA-methyltransferase [Desulfotomaculum nigrificans]
MEFPKIQKEIFNPISENVKKLAELFPSAVKDGQVDFDALKAELGQFETVSEKLSERYELGWAGKEDAKRLANTDIIGRTLKYIPEDSKNPDTTENLYIEGDNLEVLKLLRNSYYNRIKMIYIDPPYNTGKDFIYRDNFKVSEEENAVSEGEIDLLGERLIVNQKSSGRYHSNWLSMMYPRLKVAKDLLTEDGVIFISIDDNEVDNLKKICNEVFGEDNFVACIIWERAYSPVNLKKHFSENHDFVLCYAKQIDNLICNGLKRTDESIDRYKNPDNDPRGPWKPADLSVGPAIQEKRYEIITPSGRSVFPPEGRCWVYTKERYEEMLADNRIWFGESGNNVPSVKKFLSEVKNTMTPMTIWKYTEVGHSQDAAKKLIQLFDGKSYFDYPKSVDLIKRMIELYAKQDSIIMDFFSGSATTAHAVMQLNAEDGGNRKFIMVQLPEPCDEKSEAYKAGFKNICEIGRERIRRAGEKIKEENKDKEGIENLDIGFKVFRVADTNIRWFSEAIKSDNITLEEGMMSDKDRLDFNPGFTDIDVVYEILLRHRDIPLSAKVEKLYEIGERTYIFADTVVVCLEENVTESIIDKIAAIEPMPMKIIFRDSAFGDDITLKTNTMLRLEAQMKKNSGNMKKAYRVEFI